MVTINKQLNPKCIVIWLHGLGADCYDFLPFIEKFNKSEFEFILPNAPIIPITLNQGMKMRGWYDIHSLDFGFQDSEGLNSSKDYIEKIIAERVNGLTYSPKIIISGFSQGAALALYIGLTSSIKIDGVVSLSGYLPHINEDKLTNKKIPILAMHGNHDDIISLNIAKLSYKKNLSLNIDLKIYDMGHEVIDNQILNIQTFFLGVENYE